MTANRPSRRKEGSSSPTGSGAIWDALPRPPRCGIERMEIVHQPLIERIRRIDIDAVSGHDGVILKPNAANPGLARVGLQIERHSLLERDRRVLRRRTKVRSLPGI